MDNQRKRLSAFRFNASVQAYNLIKNFEGLEPQNATARQGSALLGMGTLLSETIDINYVGHIFTESFNHFQKNRDSLVL